MASWEIPYKAVFEWENRSKWWIFRSSVRLRQSLTEHPLIGG
jgi:hypothetical protein